MQLLLSFAAFAALLGAGVFGLVTSKGQLLCLAYGLLVVTALCCLLLLVLSLEPRGTSRAEKENGE